MNKIREFLKNYFASVDRLLLVLCIVISTLSVIIQFSLYNSNQAASLGLSERKVIVQLLASVLGIIAALAVSNFDYHFIAKLWKLYVPLSVFLVGLTFVVGLRVDETVDDRAWLKLPFGLSFQPSELLKICFILSFAYHLSKVKNEINKPINILLLCLHGAFPILLIHFQGDDGSALVFVFIFLTMLFSAGIDWRYILGAFGAVAVISPFVLPWVWNRLMTEDQRMRILCVYFDEYRDTLNIGYQQTRSVISIGIGQLFGKGLFSKDYIFVPNMHNDFVFSFVGQSMGFLGAMLVLALLIGICLRALHSARHAYDVLGAYICYGVFAMFFFQCVINIGMCLFLLPVIGITLPLLSAGGTSICFTYIGIGLTLSVKIHSRQNIFTR